VMPSTRQLSGEQLLGPGFRLVHVDHRRRTVSARDPARCSAEFGSTDRR
jgi:hypothetical protein